MPAGSAYKCPDKVLAKGTHHMLSTAFVRLFFPRWFWFASLKELLEGSTLLQQRQSEVDSVHHMKLFLCVIGSSAVGGMALPVLRHRTTAAAQESDPQHRQRKVLQWEMGPCQDRGTLE